MKAETFEVSDADKAMGRFRSLLGKLLKVPKREVEATRKRAKANPKRKRKA